jgi:hypothetical protein
MSLEKADMKADEFPREFFSLDIDNLDIGQGKRANSPSSKVGGQFSVKNFLRFLAISSRFVNKERRFSFLCPTLEPQIRFIPFYIMPARWQS